MASTLIDFPAETLADLLSRLGDLPPSRILVQPPPGTATEADVLARPGGVKRLCELVDGVLVEKAMGFYESRLAAVLIGVMEAFLKEHDLGIVVGAGAATRLAPGLVRIPDVSFVSRQRLPGGKVPRQPIPDLPPDLAVEVLSRGNTPGEMQRKLREYFAAGVRLVWYVDPKRKEVHVYHTPEEHTVLNENHSLDAAQLLPGFSLAIRQWFTQAE